MTSKEKELLEILTAYTTCVSLVVEHFEKEPLDSVPKRDHLRTLLTAAVQQWLLEHPETDPIVRRQVLKVHEAVLLSVDQ